MSYPSFGKRSREKVIFTIIKCKIVHLCINLFCFWGIKVPWWSTIPLMTIRKVYHSTAGHLMTAFFSGWPELIHR